MKNKLGNEVSPVKIGFFIAFVVVLLFGLISVFIIHSHLLAFITIPLFFILFIISVVLQYREVKSGRFQKNMDKLWENTKEKYGRKQIIMENENIILRTGIQCFLAYGTVNLASYILLYYFKAGSYKYLLNTGIDILLFIPIYAILVILAFSYRKSVSSDKHV